MCTKIMKFIVFVLIITYANAYRPVVLLHGIMSGADSMSKLVQEIEAQHPGTEIYNCDNFGGWFSLESAWKQVKEFSKYLADVSEKHPEGINVIGYSQGGILARAAIQALPNHNVKTFISLSSPQAGQFGTSFLSMIFPDLTAKGAFELFYSRVGQHTSVGNYWNDPHKHELYLKYSNFLPYVNNELPHSNSTQFKEGLIRLEKLVLIGGPNDGVIIPWESSHFGYYNGSFNIIPFYERSIYTTDAIGLRTLREQNKLVVVIEPFVHHLTWHTNKKVIDKVIMPYLD